MCVLNASYYLNIDFHTYKYENDCSQPVNDKQSVLLWVHISYSIDELNEARFT